MAKIDPDELVELVTEGGKTQVECAKHFGVSRSAITQKLKSLGVQALKQGIRPGCKPKPIKPKTVEVITTTANTGNETLERFRKVREDTDHLLNLAMDCIRNVKVDDADKAAVTRVQLARLLQSVQDTALKAIQRVEAQIRLELDMFQMLYDMQAVREFQEEVLKAIGEVAPDVRDAIVHKLQEKRVIRAAIQQP